MRKLAIYARVSTDDQHPEVQLAALREYAARRGEAAVEYVDRGWSGTKAERPSLDRLLRACSRGRVSALVVVKLDRLARSVRHLSNLVHDLDTLGVALVVLDQGIDTATPTGRLLLNVLGAIGEFEAELIRERTRAGLQAARRRGSKLGHPGIPSEVVERARAARAAGASWRKAAAAAGASVNAVRRALPEDRAA